MKCFRCGETDRLLRDCPLPFTKVRAYDPKKGQQPSSTLITDAQAAIDSHGSVGDNPTSVDFPHGYTIFATSAHPDPQVRTSPSLVQEEVECMEDTWIGQCFHQDSMAFTTESTEDENALIHCISESSFARPDRPGVSLLRPLVDSGAAKTVRGK